jgi:hypothetical protein
MNINVNYYYLQQKALLREHFAQDNYTTAKEKPFPVT